MSPTAWWERLLDSSSDLLTVHEPDGTVRFANSASQRLLGLEPLSMVGENPYRLLHPDDRDAVIASMERLAREPESSHAFQARARHADGSWRWLESVARNRLGDPALHGVVVSSRDVTERIAYQEALRGSEARHRELVEQAPFGMGVVDRSGRLRFANGAAARMTGFEGLESATGQSVTEFVHWQDREALLDRVQQALAEQAVQQPVECRVLRLGGDEVVVSLTVLPYEWEGAASALLIAEDVTAERLIEAQQLQSEREQANQASFLAAVLNALPAQTAIVDADGTILEVNRAWRSFLEAHGGSSDRAGPGVNYYAVCERVRGAQRVLAMETSAGLRAVIAGELTEFQQDVICAVDPDNPLYYSLQVVPLGTREGGAVLGYTDITERKSLEVEAGHRAMHDALTGLPNRALLLDRLDHALREREAEPVAVLFIDLDHFKLVNDGYGHAAGDEVLRQLAVRLTAAVRPSDTVARLSGDEFVVLCEHLPYLTEAYRLAQRVLTAVAEPFPVGDAFLTLGASIGIAEAQNGMVSPDQVLRAADQAMFEAKARGRNQWAVFDDGVHRRSVERVEQALALRELVDNDRMTVHYQPLVDLRDSTITGVEALLRWRGEQRLPDAATAVALAEEIGLIGEIGSRVLRQALQQAATFRQRDGAVLPLSVNLAPQQIDGHLVSAVTNAAETAEYPLSSLTLELTERTLMTDVRSSIDVLRELRGMGVRIAIDDFGSGYSSLAYLRDLPLDTLKIDREFVSGLRTDPEDDRIIRAIIQLAAALELDVVAEGIESEEQRVRLVELGCARGQGFLFSAAKPAAAIRALTG